MTPLLTPQPPPVHATGDVWLDVIALPHVPAVLLADMRERRQFGIDKHGTPLQVGNQRDGGADCYQELLDAIVYAERERQRWEAVPGMRVRWMVIRDSAIALAGEIRETIA